MDDVYAVERDGSLTVDETRGVLANDRGFQGTPLSAQLTFDGLGEPSLLPSGAFGYTPPAAYTGPATFRYRADDASGSSLDGTVSLRVQPPPGPDLLGYWPFDENTGAVAFDGSGHARSGEIGAALWSGETADASPGSLFFDGSGDVVTFPAPFTATGTALSVTAWIRPWIITGLTKDGRIVAKGTGDQEPDYDLLLATGLSGGEVRLLFRIRTTEGVATLRAESGEVLAGAWYHAAAVYDGAALRLYLNGVPVGEKPHTGELAMIESVPLAIGNQPPGTGWRPGAATSTTCASTGARSRRRRSNSSRSRAITPSARTSSTTTATAPSTSRRIPVRLADGHPGEPQGDVRPRLRDGARGGARRRIRRLRRRRLAR